MDQSRTVFAISGGDRVKFLQSLVTNDVTRARDVLIYTALLTPQGKFLFDFFMLDRGDDILIDSAADQGPALMQRLSMYKLRADVVVTPLDLHVHRGLGEQPNDGLPDPRHTALGWRAYREVPQTNDPTDWVALRVAHLVPETGAELIANDSYILEMNFQNLNGVDFRKGCYVGQEVTARMKHKTELRKGLAQVSVTGECKFGDEITADGKSIGQILSRSGDTALAYIRFDRATDGMQAGDAQVALKTD